MTGTEISVLLTLFLLFTLPGISFLAISRLDRRYRLAQNICLAIGFSTAFYPVLFYALRELFPDFQLGQRKLIALLILLLIPILIRVVFDLQRDRQKSLWQRFNLSFTTSDWITLGVFSLVIFNRLWMAHLYPFPAWSDSLHHTLLTQLTAQNGRLPTDIEPFAPVNLDMYHLGLYALSGSVQILSEAPAHTALLWTAQFLNAMSVIGIFLVLDVKVSRKAALAGSLVAGIFSMQPAWYINWGRFTQVASQSILLVGWFINWETIWAWSQTPASRRTLAALTFAAVVLNTAIFELHFRVAGYYLPLVLLVCAWEVWRAARAQRARQAIISILVIGALSILLILPFLLDSLRVYLQATATTAAAAAQMESRNLSYFQSPLANHYIIGLQPWLLVLTGLFTVILLTRRNQTGFLVVLWVVSLWLEGHAYLLQIEVLSFTNYDGIIIMYYLPASLLIGIGVHELFAWLPSLNKPNILQPTLTLLLAGAVFTSHIHSQVVDPDRYFLTSADLLAMDWVKTYTSPDSLFAINTLFWLKSAAHGTDGGYWIPYFTGRQTTASNMLYSYGDSSYQQQVMSLSEEVTRQQSAQVIDLTQLCRYGVDYIYLGAHPSPIPTFTPERIAAAPGATLVYDAKGVKIFQICSKSP